MEHRVSATCGKLRESPSYGYLGLLRVVARSVGKDAAMCLVFARHVIVPILGAALLPLSFIACGNASSDTGTNDDSTPSGEGSSTSSGGASNVQGSSGASAISSGASGTSVGGSAGMSGNRGVGGASGHAGMGGGAGGTNSGGQGGGGGGSGMPPKIGACNGLPKAGTWEKITPPDVMETDAIIVDPLDTATIWLGGKDHGIFKSTDCGATFTHVSTGRNAMSVNSGAPGSMQADPVHPGTLYTTSFYGAEGLWKSTNGGVDWDPMFPAGSEVAKVVQYNLTNSIAIGATNPNHLVAAMHADCAKPYTVVCEAESLDAGATWKITSVDIGANGWVAGAGAFILDDASWLFGTYSLGLWLTTDHGATFKNVTPAGGSGSTSGKTIITPFRASESGTYYLAAMEGVLKSSDGKTWLLIKNSGGRSVGFAMDAGHLFSADQWSATYHESSDSDSSTWKQLPAPSGLAADQGAPYLQYDDTHHLLYSSNWAGGAWRYVTE